MRIITLNENNKIVGVKKVGDNCILSFNDLISEVGEMGQIMQPDGTFIDAPTEPQPNTPSIEERVSAIEDTLLMII